MSLAHSEDRVSIPEETDLRQLAGRLARELEDRESVRSVEIKDTDEGYTVRGMTDRSLLSWGEEIRIRITPGTVHIVSESPDQWIDWGKSDENVDTVSQLVQEFSRQTQLA